MPRQNQDAGSHVRKITGVTPVSKGGTGASTPHEAVVNLKGLHRADIDKANGLAEVDQNGLLKSEYFGNLDIYIGPRIKGPKVLYRGCMARFQVMNFASELTVEVQVKDLDKKDIHYVAQGKHFAFRVPSSYTASDLTVIVKYDGVTREITIPVEDASIGKPTLGSPSGTVFSSDAWVELSFPDFKGESYFDEFLPSGVTGFRGNTFTTNQDGTHIIEFSSYSGRKVISIPATTSEIRIAGALKTSQGYAYVKVDGVFYPLGRVYDEISIKPKSSMVVEIVTSSGEEVWLATTHPVNGNQASSSQVYLDAVLEISPYVDGPWNDAGTLTHRVSDSLSIPLKGLATGERFMRVKYRYTAGSVTLESPYSDVVSLKVDSTNPLELKLIQAPYVNVTTNFGRSVRLVERDGNDEVFVSATVAPSGAGIVFRYLDNGTTLEHKEAISLPHETTRVGDAGFGAKVVVSADGDTLYVAAPTATFSDVNGTTGAVYVYRRINGRFVFVKRMMDENRVYQGYGRSIDICNGRLFVLMKASVTQKPVIYVYDVTGEAGNAALLSTYSIGTAGQVNISDISAANGVDAVLGKYPLMAVGAQKNPSTGEILPATFYGWLDTSNDQISGNMLYSTGAVALFGQEVSNDKIYVSYLGHDNADDKHHVLVQRYEPESGLVSFNEYAFNVADGDYSTAMIARKFPDFNIPIQGLTKGSIAVSHDTRVAYVGDEDSSVTISTPTGNVVYTNAGYVHRVQRSIQPNEVPPA